MHKLSYKEQERQRRENEILRVAGEMLAERGYANLNMDELADVVGISKPTLYQHFKGKEELVAQVIAHNMETFSQVTEDATEGTPIERITKMLRTMAKGRSKSGGICGTMNSETVWKVFKDNPVLIEQRKRFGERVQLLIDEAKAAGEISESLPTPLVLRIMFCMQMAINDPYRASDAAISEAETDEAINNVITIFLHGVCPYRADEKPELQSPSKQKN